MTAVFPDLFQRSESARVVSLELLSAEVSARTTWWVVRIRTDSGAVGLGEFSDAGDAGAQCLAVDVLGALAPTAAAGVDAGTLLSQVRGLSDRTTAPRRRHMLDTVFGGLEQALADAAAREAGIPLWRWLGGEAPCDVFGYANINRALRTRSEAEHAEVAAAAVAAGFTAVKCAPFDALAPDELLAGGLARVRAVRRAVGDDIVVMFDALAAVHARGIAPLASGETCVDPDEVRPAAESGLLAWGMPDVKHAGLSGTLALAGVTSRAGVSFPFTTRAASSRRRRGCIWRSAVPAEGVPGPGVFPRGRSRRARARNHARGVRRPLDRKTDPPRWTSSNWIADDDGSVDNFVHEIVKRLGEVALTSAYVVERKDSAFEGWNCAVCVDGSLVRVDVVEDLVEQVHLNLLGERDIIVAGPSHAPTNVVRASAGLSWTARQQGAEA